MKAKISEIFKSIQGEGLYQGQEQVFVRFYGCNINCSFCDTKLTDYQEKSVDEVLKATLSYGGCDCVSLTGGEPLLYADFVKSLAAYLKSAGKEVHLETNGIIHDGLKKTIDFIDVVAMDFKLPSSTKLTAFWREHEEFLKVALLKKVFIKIVIGVNTHTQDILKSIEIIKKINVSIPLILQPENPLENTLVQKLLDFKDVCSAEGINVGIMSQLHKKMNIK